MVVKAIINAIGKSKVKPRQFPEGAQKIYKARDKNFIRGSSS